MDAERDHTKTDRSAQSTWGATPEAKEEWDRKHGSAARKAVEKANAGEKADKEETK